MTPLDWLVIGLYFALLVGLTWWSVLRSRTTADDYFLAGRDLGWVVVGASIFASNIGSEHLVGLAGAGATSGVALAHYELHAWCLLVLGWVMVPDRRQLSHAATGPAGAHGVDLRHSDGRTAPRLARDMEPLGRDEFGRRPPAHRRCVPVFQRVIKT